MKAVKKGSELNQPTQDAFKENIDIAGKHAKLIDDVAVASRKQAQGIEQVSNAVVQMNQVTQTNAANAEESASASEELNAQFEQFHKMFQELSTIVGGSNGAHNGGIHGAHRAREVFGTVHPRATGLLHHGPEGSQAQATAVTPTQKHRRLNEVTERKRSARKNPERVIPLYEGEGKEKDEETLRKF